MSEDIEFRYTELSDGKFLKQCLMQPDAKLGFPMDDEPEVEDAVNRWIGFYRYKCSLTATKNGKPVGIATLFLQPYKRIAHQCEFGILVADGYRNEGIGSKLIKNLIHLAKERFGIELLHLQVYADNPAVKLYERHGFKVFGEQKGWIKEDDGSYTGRIFMEKYLKD